jgi:hypothetical protein
LAVLSATTGCSHKAPAPTCKSSDNLTALKLLQPQNAENDARRDYARDDHRLLGINGGVGFSVPGLTGDPFNSGYGLRTFDSSDVSCDPEELQVKNDAWNYAQKYNHQMMLLWQPSKSSPVAGASTTGKDG